MLQWRLQQQRLLLRPHRQCLHNLAHPIRPVKELSARRRRPNRSKALREALTADPNSPYTPLSSARPKPQLSYIDRRNAAHSPVPTLQDILAKYIIATRDGSLRPDGLLDEQSMLFLHNNGYSISNVRRWALILSDYDSVTDAADHLVLSLCNDDKPVPIFVYMRLLQRQNLPVEALRQLLHYAWHVAKNRQSFNIDDSTAMLMVVRLLRHCRLAWPEAIITVTHLYIQFFQPKHSDVHDPDSLALQAARSNRLLSLLALPIAQGPLIYSSLQLRAQFDLLEWMAAFTPPLPILRKGYRAIIQTQLASAKTAQEKDWAQLKAKTWPPWKSDRTGLDADKGPEYGVSGALQAIRRAREAGYGSEAWEYVAQVLSGWDLDNSPTIQTRAVHLHRAFTAKSSSSSQRNSPAVWAAKIRATRTVNEAWAAFLSWRKLDLPANSVVYIAMLEKIQAEDMRKASQNPTPHPTALPGDTRDVWPVSDSPKESVYVPEPPPPFNQLVLEMHSTGCFPHGPGLSFLVSHASSLDDGCNYIMLAAQREPAFLALLNDSPHREQRLDKVPLHLLNAFVQLCARFTFSVPAPISVESKTFTFGGSFPLIHALRLLMRRKPAWRPPWYTVLSALALRPRFSTARHPDSPRLLFQTLDRYRTMVEIRKQMKALGLEIDAAGVLHLCRGLEFAIVAANRVSANKLYLLPRSNEDLPGMANSVLHSGFGYIRGLFYALFGTRDARKIHLPAPEDPLALHAPALLAVPRPHVLHAYARVVGLLRNWNGLLELARWLAAHHASVHDAAQLTPSGLQMLRRTVVAVRVFAEVGWSLADEDSAQQAAPPIALVAPRSTVDKIRQALDGCGDWAAWPSDDEVEEYCANMYKIM